MLNGNEMDMALSFIPLLRLVLVPRGFLWAVLSRSPPVRAAEGIWSMLMREMEFEMCLQFTLSFFC